ncbi:MAG: hypothetical protein C4323_14810, partial [Mastigocladus sp. ERB_26_2]
MQSPAGSFETISPTAYMVAYARQFTDIPYSKELAQLVDAQTFMEQLREKNLEQPAEIAVTQILHLETWMSKPQLRARWARCSI